MKTRNFGLQGHSFRCWHGNHYGKSLSLVCRYKSNRRTVHVWVALGSWLEEILQELRCCASSLGVGWGDNNDIVTRVPLRIMGYTHDGIEHYMNAYGLERKLTTWQRTKDRWRGMWGDGLEARWR